MFIYLKDEYSKSKEEAQKVGYAPTNPNVAKRWDELDNKPLNEDS